MGMRITNLPLCYLFKLYRSIPSLSVVINMDMLSSTGIPSTEFLQIEPSAEPDYPFSIGPYESLRDLFDL